LSTRFAADLDVADPRDPKTRCHAADRVRGGPRPALRAARWRMPERAARRWRTCFAVRLRAAVFSSSQFDQKMESVRSESFLNRASLRPSSTTAGSSLQETVTAGVLANGQIGDAPGACANLRRQPGRISFKSGILSPYFWKNTISLRKSAISAHLFHYGTSAITRWSGAPRDSLPRPR
jgi:hypothetical protein